MLTFLPPDMNVCRYNFVPEQTADCISIRVPLRQINEMTVATLERYEAERAKAKFNSMHDFYMRVGPSIEEMQNLIRVGAFDSFEEKRTAA